jgi:hypothetical protein
MHKFKVYRLTDINQIEEKLNSFDLGYIRDYQIAAPDYRIIVLVIRYTTDEEAKNDKASK